MFSYAILGPLHYLTEINWLRDKNYFIKSKKYWIIPFVIFSIAMVIYPVFSIIDVGFGNAILKGVNFIGGQTNNLLLIGFLFAVSLIFFKKPKNILSEIGIRIQVFIAFAYTYHYLNWFSKTSIIGWKKSITKRKAYLIGFIWILAVSIYMYDFKTGYIALFFLSFLHVFLEFPLNIISIKEIFSLTRIKRRLVNNS